MKSLLLGSLLLLSICSSISLCWSNTEQDEVLSFLEEQERDDAPLLDDFRAFGRTPDFENYDDLDDEFSASADEEASSAPEVDESHRVVLKEANFSRFVESNRFVLVEFYAPWCGHCHALVPEYAAAAEDLKDEEVFLAKVDAAEEAELSQKYDVQGFPTIYLFVDGVQKPYTGQRTRDAVVSWLKKKLGPGLHNIASIEQAERILAIKDKIVVGYLDGLVGPETEELATASELGDDVGFYQTTSPEVAQLFHMDPSMERPSLVMLKKETEKLNHFVGEFRKSAIAEFVYENKLPLVTNFTRERAPTVFENSIKKQLILFAPSSELERH